LDAYLAYGILLGLGQETAILLFARDAVFSAATGVIMEIRATDAMS
jgi:hypothetical protein